MKTRRFWGSISQKTTFLFIAAAVVSVFALIWTGLRLMRQDRVLELQQLEEMREAAAERVIAGLEQILSNEERKLVDPQSADILPGEQDYILVLVDSEGIRVRPDDALLYYPVLPTGHEAPSQPFLNSERAEFQAKDYIRAISLLHPLSRSGDPSIRAAAKLRLARNLRKAGRPQDALELYNELTKTVADSMVMISGVPVDLVARRARCALLEELGDLDRLREGAERLFEDLMNKHWRLDRASFLYYREQAEEWLARGADSNTGPRALAEAVIWLWENRSSAVNAEKNLKRRHSLLYFDRSITLLWQESKDRLAAVVAGPTYQKSQWFEPLFKSPDFSPFNVNLRDPEGSLVFGKEIPSDVPFTSRTALVSGLSWDIGLVYADPEAGLSQFAQRRRFFMAGLGMLTLLVIAVSYLINRAVSRELAAARLQSDFVSAVSHEFRTPLTSMRQFTEMLNEDDSLPAEKRRVFYQAQARATNRLSRLVESFLDFGRMEAGARPYRLEQLNVGRLAKTVVEEFLQETGSDGLLIECIAPSEGTQVKGDEESLSQALWNLLDNAVKYSGESNKVRVEVEVGDFVSIRVRDQGFGIPSSERSRILRKFVRGSNALVHGIKGTGIGLAVVKHIVDAHGGKVLIESEPGQGSTFTIQLPAGG